MTTEQEKEERFWKACDIEEGWKGYPSTSDLNALFKYAVPVAVDKLHNKKHYSSEYAIATIWEGWRLEAGSRIPDAPALYQVLCKIMEVLDETR